MDLNSKFSRKFFHAISSSRIYPSWQSYDLTVCNDPKFLWFSVPKVGTQTLVNFFDLSNLKLQYTYSFFIRYPINRFKSHYKFGFIRNPYDRIVSCWRDKIIKYNYFEFPQEEWEQLKDFKQFLRWVTELKIEEGFPDVHLMPQHRLIDLNHIDYLGRFESFAEDFRTICGHLGLPNENLEKKNPSPRSKSYRDYFDDECRDLVSQIYRKDLQIFGYPF